MPAPVPSLPLEQVADRVWALYAGSNAVVVAGDRGAVVVDAGASVEDGAALAEWVRRLDRPLVAVVLTHDHDEHRAGLPALLGAFPEATVHAHEDAAGVRVDRPFSSVAVVDLGDRIVELVHPGRGHTAADVVVRVPDADVVVAGDLVGGDGVPSYGGDCHPLDWPGALDLVVGMVTEATVVVPGHGRPVRREELQDQRGSAGVVAETLFDLASRSVALDAALTSADWPFPVDRLGEAVRRGYDQIPRTARRLPLV